MARKPIKTGPSVRNLEVYKAVCEGKLSQAAIAKDFGVSQQRVSVIYAEVKAWHRPSFDGDVKSIKQTQTQLLMYVFMEAMEEWERSKKDARMSRLKVADSTEENPTGIERTKERRGQCGDSSYLEKAMKALEGIRKIWGADAPLQTEDVSKISDPRALVKHLKERMEALAAGKTEKN